MHDGLVARYSKDFAYPEREGAFIACSYWLADVYVMLGRIDEAVELFERLLKLRNDLGLLSEEYDLGARRLVGNFPQGFAHIGLINTAFNLVKKAQGPAQQRSRRTAPAQGKKRQHRDAKSEKRRERK
jgi:GH15 family glucan-1,4-alpha-glucosidase